MRTLLAIAMLAGGIVALDTSADSAEPAKKRSMKSRPYAAEARPRTREAVECERAQHEDPSGSLAGYPCWAREVLGGSKNRSDH
jgi:hypothetical protein